MTARAGANKAHGWSGVPGGATGTPPASRLSAVRPVPGGAPGGSAGLPAGTVVPAMPLTPFAGDATAAAGVFDSARWRTARCVATADARARPNTETITHVRIARRRAWRRWASNSCIRPSSAGEVTGGTGDLDRVRGRPTPGVIVPPALPAPCALPRGGAVSRAAESPTAAVRACSPGSGADTAGARRRTLLSTAGAHGSRDCVSRWDSDSRRGGRGDSGDGTADQGAASGSDQCSASRP